MDDKIAIPGERFTLWLNGAGEPVEKALAEMTAGEVRQALDWHEEEVRRLTRIAAPAHEMAEEVARGGQPSLTEAEWKNGLDAMEAEVAAIQKMRRLMLLVRAGMPQWPGSGMTAAAALSRYWPRR